MGIDKQVIEIIESGFETFCDNNNLEEALAIYHEWVEKKIIIPRGNQLIPEDISYRSSRNF